MGTRYQSDEMYHEQNVLVPVMFGEKNVDKIQSLKGQSIFWT